jgi:hypothetical protein
MRYRRLIYCVLLILIVPLTGCIKETYDFDVLSKKALLSPTLILPLLKGSAAFSDIVSQGDMLVTGSDGSVKLVFRKDSVIFLERNDLYDLDDMVSYNRSFRTGNLKIDQFGGSLSFTPSELSDYNTVKAFPEFNNFKRAVFSSGFMELKVINRTPVATGAFKFSLLGPRGSIGDLSVPALMAGEEFAATISLAAKELGRLSVELSGVPIDIGYTEGDLLFLVNAKEPMISSGQAVIPLQMVSRPGDIDHLDLFPGTGVEIDNLLFSSGRLTWKTTSSGLLGGRFDITLPTAFQYGQPVTEHLAVNALINTRGGIQLAGVTANLNSDPVQPFNRIPFSCDLYVSSNNRMVYFSCNDNVNLEMRLSDSEPDFAKGYFGRQVHSIPAQTLETGIEEFTRNLKGRISFTDPVVRLIYSNSFSFPINVALDVEGKRGAEMVSLGLDPFAIDYPSSPEKRNVHGSYVIGKNNSSLPELISLPPDEIVISGSAKFNPDEAGSTSRNNYIFEASRFVASVEVEVPLSMRLDKIHLSDTLDNFLSGGKINSAMKMGKSAGSPGVSILRLDLDVKNGFPFDVACRISLFDTYTGTVKSSLDASQVLKAAGTDQNGIANTTTVTTTRIDFSNEFFNSINDSDKIIIDFFVNTSGFREVRIFAGYKIDFSAAVTVRPEFEFLLP